jgi:hypothetical protein
MKVYIKIALCNVVLLILACKEQYPLPTETSNLNMLVVEGYLNSGPGPTIVRLSRTSNPNEITNFVAESRAQVFVQGEDNTNFVLTGNNSGEYTNTQLKLAGNQKYRLKIITANGKEYLSDFVPVLSTPAIDSVHWKRDNVGVQFLVSTHDPQNKTWYYRWEYDETWEIHSYFISNYVYRDPNVVPRPDPFAFYFCWKYDASKAVLINSSARLSQDVISGQPLINVQSGHEKISVRYSIRVKQYALTKEAYQFWEIMKKNTEQVGTLFDPQPSQLLSNIRSVNDPDHEQVIGFVSAGTISEKRIFVKESEVRPWAYRRDCEQINVTRDSFRFYFSNQAFIPLDEWYNDMGRLAGYTGGERSCVDCTLAGSPVKPAFW